MIQGAVVAYVACIIRLAPLSPSGRRCPGSYRRVNESHKRDMDARTSHGAKKDKRGIRRHPHEPSFVIMEDNSGYVLYLSKWTDSPTTLDTCFL